MDFFGKENWKLKTLEEIATKIYSGSGIKKDQLTEAGHPAIRYSEIHKFDLFIHECRNFVNPSSIKNKRYCEYGDLLITKVSEDLENAGKAISYLGTVPAMIGDAIFLIKHNQNPKYLSYAMSTEFVKKQIKDLIPRGVVMNFKKSNLLKIKIPLPPRNIQDKIADFLDQLLNLKEVLKDELIKETEERVKQYQYYRDLLIVGWEEDGKRMGNLYHTQTIGEIAIDICIGGEVTKSQLGTGNYPAIKCGDINSGLPLHFKECISFVDPNLIKNKRFFEHGDLLVGKIGNLKTAGKASVYLGHDKCLLGDAVYRVKHNQNHKYLAYVWTTDFVRKQIESFYKSGTVFNFFIRELRQIQIPLPSLEEQAKIVSSLDQFHEMCGDLTNRIPELIEEVEKQYQYYRDKIIN